MGSNLRQKINFNTQWEFIKGNFNNPSDLNVEIKKKSDYNWKSVNLPHSPQIEPKEFYTHWQGVSWYKRKFYASSEWKNRRVVIKFEAVMQKADIWINGKFIKSHKGGYLPFIIDVSNKLIFDSESLNEIIVKADNRNMPDIPPGKPLKKLDMTYQGGIYRSVNIIISDKLYITDAVNANKVSGGGVFITYPKISKEKAIVKVKTHVKNSSNIDYNYQINTQIINTKGIVVAEVKSINSNIPSRKEEHVTNTLTVKNPQLWHPNNPTLYTVKTSIEQGDKVIDEVTSKIGIRTINWHNDGFYINGEKLILNGANRHQDGIYVGNALPESVQRLEALKLKEAGFNNVRAGHYPLDPAFMAACDEYGLTVIVCIPGWQFFRDNPEFKNNCYQNIRDLIRRDRNHASVILYELALNETLYTNEYAKMASKISQDEYKGCFIACDYKYPAHKIYNVNYKVPQTINIPTFTREWGDDNRYCGVRKWKNTLIWGDWARRDNESSMLYQSLARQKDLNGDGYWDWYGVNANKKSAGYALWVGFDHNRGGSKNIARCGIWGLDRYPKFCYYFLQSQRNPVIKLNNINSGPMIFIASFWRKSSLPDVNVYSNCDKVKLFLNNKLIATQTPDKTYNEGSGNKPINHVPHPIFTFKNIKWQAGILKAEGIIKGKIVASHIVKTPEKAARLIFKMDHLTPNLTANGSDMAMLYIKAIDKNGTLVPDFKGKISLNISGEGRLIGNIPVQAEGGIAAVWLRSTTKAGKLIITAHNKDLGTYLFSTTSDRFNGKIVLGPQIPKPEKIRKVESNNKQYIKKNSLRKITNFTVKTSSTKDGYSALSLIDGNRESWWIAADNKKQFIELKLNKPTDLKGSLIVWEKDSTWYTFSIDVSKDGKKWHQVYQDKETGHDFNPEKWQARQVRYVKINLHSVNPLNSLLGVRLVELYK